MEWRYLPESLIVFVAITLGGILFIREQRRKKLGIVFKLKSHLKVFQKMEDPFRNDYLNSIPRSTFKVLRDDNWINV